MMSSRWGKMLRRWGRDCVVERMAPGTYNEATGAQTPTVTESVSGKGVFVQVEDEMRDGVSITAGSEDMFIDAAYFTSGNPVPGDRVLQDSRRRHIRVVTPHFDFDGTISFYQMLLEGSVTRA